MPSHATRQDESLEQGSFNFIVIGGFLALIAIGVGSYLFFRSRRLKRERAEAEQQKREQNQRDRQRYQSRISDLTTMLGTIEVGAKITPRATVHYSTALAALSHAQTSLDNDDFEETAKYLRQANAFYERAESLINGGSDPVADTQYATRPGTDNVPSTPRTAGRPDISGISQQTSATSSNTVNVRFRHPQTQEIIVISDPMPVYSVRYPYEWGGGMVGNKFLPPGFYPYEVWDTNAGWGDPITNLLVAEQLGEISVANREAYETGLVAGSMGTVSGGDYGGSTYVDPGVTPDNIVPDISSGGDYGSTPSYVDPDPAPAYDPPTYDSGSSYTDNNYGGGDYS